MVPSRRTVPVAHLGDLPLLGSLTLGSDFKIRKENFSPRSVCFEDRRTRTACVPDTFSAG